MEKREAVSPAVVAVALTVTVVEILLVALHVDTGGRRLLWGTESVPLGFHDSVSKRMPVLGCIDPMVQTITSKMIFPTFVIWSSTLPGIKTPIARGTASPLHRLLH